MTDRAVATSAPAVLDSATAGSIARLTTAGELLMQAGGVMSE